MYGVQRDTFYDDYFEYRADYYEYKKHHPSMTAANINDFNNHDAESIIALLMEVPSLIDNFVGGDWILEFIG